MITSSTCQQPITRSRPRCMRSITSTAGGDCGGLCSARLGPPVGGLGRWRNRGAGPAHLGLGGGVVGLLGLGGDFVRLGLQWLVANRRPDVVKHPGLVIGRRLELRVSAGAAERRVVVALVGVERALAAQLVAALELVLAFELELAGPGGRVLD